MSQEEIKIIRKKITEVEMDKKRALFDYNYHLASHLNGILESLNDELKKLEKNSENPETI